MSTQESRTAMVTGAASGIGRATAVKLATDHASVVLVDIDREGLELTARTVSSVGAEAVVADVDLSDAAALQSVVGRLVTDRDIDVLVNNAGIGYAATAVDTSLEQWDRTLAVDLTAVFLLCRAVVPGMVVRGHGTLPTS